MSPAALADEPSRNRPISSIPSSGHSRKFASLDGLRAISILIVFLSHALPANGRFTVPGNFGVTIFFFLSGYLITTLLRTEYDEAGRISLKAFYLRRLLRIFPPLYFTIAVVWFLCRAGVMHDSFAPTALGAVFLQMGNYWMIHYGVDSLPTGLGVLWSLAVEEHFYLFFPLLYLGLRRVVTRPLAQAGVLWGLCLAIMLWRFVLVFGLHASTTHLRLSTDARLDSIMFGCALAVFGNPVLDPTRFSKRIWTLVLFPLGVFALLASHAIPNADVRECMKYSLQGFALIPVFCAAVRYPNWAWFRVLNWRPCAFLGVLSYSFYLVHAVIVGMYQRLVPDNVLGNIGVGFSLSLLVAWGMHLCIEQPANRLRRQLASAQPARATTGTMARNRAGVEY